MPRVSYSSQRKKIIGKLNRAHLTGSGLDGPSRIGSPSLKRVKQRMDLRSRPSDGVNYPGLEIVLNKRDPRALDKALKRMKRNTDKREWLDTNRPRLPDPKKNRGWQI